MKQNTPASKGSLTHVAAGRVVAVYAVFACLWIVLSDSAVVWLFSDPATIALVSTAKGWLFVAVTALLLFGLIQRMLSQVLKLSRQEHEAQSERSKTERLLTAIVRSSSDAIFVKDTDGRYLLFNQEAGRVTGKTIEQVIGVDDRTLFPPPQARIIQENDRRVMDSNLSITYEELITTVDGERTYLATKGPLHSEDGTVFGLFGISRDITERKTALMALHASEVRFRTVFEKAYTGMAVADPSGNILEANESLSLLLGYARSELIGMNIGQFTHGDDLVLELGYLAEIASGHRDDYRMEKRYLTRDGAIVWVDLLVTVIRDEAGKAEIVIGLVVDITERKSVALQIEHLAFYDSLTDLPNRRLMMDRLKQALTSCARRNRYGALMLIDLDNFKTLNDTRGHDVGDQLLVQVASRLKSAIREGDTIARLGGDEFVAILEDLDASDDAAALQAQAVADKIQSQLNLGYALQLVQDGGTRSHSGHHCTSSIGITLFHDQSVSIDELMKRADTAMYQAKAGGRNTLRFYDPDMQAVVARRAAVEVDLRKAVMAQQFVLYYQAQVDLSGKIMGAEVLLRWQHPEQGLVAPGLFIAVAEDTGLILPIGQWVLEQACQQLALWACQPPTEHLTLAVNVSARQFSLPNFVELVLATVTQTGANPRRLKLELTESLLLENAQDIITKMTALKASGIGFSLDDFGTGYSSLSYLKRLPLDQLKIDQSFVRDVLTDSNDAVIARTIVALAQSLGLGVIAEGVETIGQRDFLAGVGCPHFQGYLFGRPQPLSQFEAPFSDA